MNPTEFLGRGAAEVIDELKRVADDLDLHDLEALRDAEVGDKNRTTVLAAIARVIESLEEPDEEPAPESDKSARGEQPDWQKPDYSGPLTATQALWRGKHITTK